MKLNFEQLKIAVSQAHEKFASLRDGTNATYIPELTKPNPDDFAISVVSITGETFSVGNSDIRFSLQSASKPFIYGLALEQHGQEKTMQKVGVEPSGEAFNSIIELEEKSHLPFNSMINSGAIATTHLLLKEDCANRTERIVNLFNDLGDMKTEVDQAIYQSEKKTAFRNQAIASLLRHFGVVDEHIDESLDLYFQQCSVLSNSEQLANMAATLANYGVEPHSQKQIFSAPTVRDILSVMFTCGMYDTAGKWAYSVGIPSKSGVSGVIFGVVPGKFGIATYSPRIDHHGHSLRGMRTFEYLSQKLNLHIFSGDSDLAILKKGIL